MMHLTLKSEYSFGQCFGYLKSLHDNYSSDGVIGIADTNTFSFYKLEQMCKKSGVKPIYGYRCTVVNNATQKVKPRGQFGKEYIIIAKNVIGLREIFNLTKIMSQNFYYRGNVSVSDINSLSNNVIVISTDPVANRLDYLGIGFTTPERTKNYRCKKVFVDQNFYSSGEDKPVYQLYAGRNANDKSCPQHILCEEEAIAYFGKECVDSLLEIEKSVDRFDLPLAENVEYKGKEKIADLSIEGAKRLGVDLTDPVYQERFDKEISLLEDKGFSDYLMVVAEIIKEAKRYSLVGPGRGSSGGSLICYLLGITTFDPIKYDLIFERFIDVNRFDAPDIDFDVPDKYRGKVVKWMEKRYGIDNVKTISNITRFKPKSAIGEFAKAMGIPRFETEAVKDMILHRAPGDARAAFAMEDTFQETDAGVEFIEKFPEMKTVTQIENHAKNKGKHAAGVIICNKSLANYCGIDERDGTVYLDKKDAEGLNLLKVDALGLRTLSVLQDCAKSIGMDYNDFYDLPLDDEKSFEVFKNKRLGGVFQFEGEAVKSINHSAPMEHFEDIVAAGALGRPGSLSSGGTSRYIKLRNGEREPTFYCDKHKRITESTYGVVVYQETMMALCKEISGMSWEDVSSLRKAASKSLGEEFFDKYRIKFVEGAIALSGYDEETANKAWLDISSMGSYAFNRSHSVAYAYISYWCVHGQTKLFDWDNKRFITIANAYRNGVENIACYDEETGKTIKGKVKKVIRTTGAKNLGKKKAIKIKLKNRRKIICSHDHKILTDNGYIRAIDLSIGDNIMCEKLCVEITDSLIEKRSESFKRRWGSEEREALIKCTAKGGFATAKSGNHYSHYNHMSDSEKEQFREDFRNNVQPLAAEANIGSKRYLMSNGKKTNSMFETLFENTLIDLGVDYEWQKLVDNKEYEKDQHQFSDFFINGVYIELELNKRDKSYYDDKYCCGESYIVLGGDTGVEDIKLAVEQCFLAEPILNGDEIVLSKITSITDYEDSVMYDVVMENEPHNYLADNIVVHNCSYMKAHHPLQFIAAILNNSKDDDNSLKILREFYESENLKFKAVDPMTSGVNWEIRGDELVGGLTNIKGVGAAKAMDIIKVRKGEKTLTPAMLNMLEKPKTPFSILYPARHHFGNLYKNPTDFGVPKIHLIDDVNDPGEYCVIGKMLHVDDVHVNDVQAIAKRGGEVLSGPDMKVHIRIEDDTGVIMCILGRFVYEQMADEFLREKVGSTWYCIMGKIMPGIRVLFITQVANLNKQIGLNEGEEER